MYTESINVFLYYDRSCSPIERVFATMAETTTDAASRTEELAIADHLTKPEVILLYEPKSQTGS